ncbi:MAG: tautomerase family protein [Desulfovibrionaceae bacterium]|nr:tautomerase family protein [Desulfovibrionaceae bacterium]
MPVVTFEAASLSVEQKRQLVKEFTETATRVTGLPKETIFVFLKENKADNVGVGGVLLSEKQGNITV